MKRASKDALYNDTYNSMHKGIYNVYTSKSSIIKYVTFNCDKRLMLLHCSYKFFLCQQNDCNLKCVYYKEIQ